jgi:UDP-glucose 4-epimerase
VECDRILLTSTSEVYGDPLEHPQTEEYWGNVNPIGTTKVNLVCQCILHMQSDLDRLYGFSKVELKLELMWIYLAFVQE